MIEIVLDLVVWLLGGSFMVWLLVYCLRIGAVGPGKAIGVGDAHRDREPVRFWIGIATIALGIAAWIAISFEAIWVSLR